MRICGRDRMLFWKVCSCYINKFDECRFELSLLLSEQHHMALNGRLL